MTTVRRVRRIIRKIDPWTVLKVSAVFNVVLALGLILGVVMLWSVVSAAGIPDRVTSFLVKITLLEEGENPFANSERFLRATVFGSVVFAVLATGWATVAAVMYNLVSDVVGGVELVLLEESLSPPAATAVSPARPHLRTTPPTGNGPPPTSPADIPTEETPISTP
jgi:hypothetical protein